MSAAALPPKTPATLLDPFNWTPANRAQIEAVLRNTGSLMTVLAKHVVMDVPSFDNLVGTYLLTNADVAGAIAIAHSPYFESTKLVLLDDQRKVKNCLVSTLGQLHETIYYLPHAKLEAVADWMAAECNKVGATSIVPGHNHPNGDSRPSEKDIIGTNMLRPALWKRGIRLIDHVVTNHTYSTVFSGELHKPIPGDVQAPWEVVKLGSTEQILKPKEFHAFAALLGQNKHNRHLVVLSNNSRVLGVARFDYLMDPVDLATQANLFFTSQGASQAIYLGDGFAGDDYRVIKELMRALPLMQDGDDALRGAYQNLGKTHSFDIAPYSLDPAVIDQHVAIYDAMDAAVQLQSQPELFGEDFNQAVAVTRLRGLAQSVLEVAKHTPRPSDLAEMAQNHLRSEAMRALDQAGKPGHDAVKAYEKLRDLLDAAPARQGRPASAPAPEHPELFPSETPQDGLLLFSPMQLFNAGTGQAVARKLGPWLSQDSRDWFKRWFGWGEHVGGRAPELNRLEQQRLGEMAAERNVVLRQAGKTVGALKALEAIMPKVGADARRRMFEAVAKGDLDPAKVPASITSTPEGAAALAAVLEARAEVDKLSKALLVQLGDQLSPTMQMVIDENDGKYFVRPYAKFLLPDYRPAPEVRERAAQYIASQILDRLDRHAAKLQKYIDRYRRADYRELLRRFMLTGNQALLGSSSPTFTRTALRLRAVYRAISERFNEWVSASGPADNLSLNLDPNKMDLLVNGTVDWLLQKDTRIEHVFGGQASPQWKQIRKSFIQRKMIPEAIRELFGEVHDVAALQQVTTMRMRQMLVADAFQKQALALSDAAPDGDRAKLFYRQPVTTADGRKYTFHLQGPAFGVLNDTYTDRPTFELLAQVDRTPYSEWWMKAYMTTLVLPRYLKTVANPATWMRNFGTNYFFAMADGEMLHPSYALGWKDCISALSDVGQWEDLMRFGVVSASAHGSELKATLDECFGGNAASLLDPAGAHSKIMEWIRAGGDKVSRGYALVDNLHKAAAYFSKLRRGIDPETAMRRVRESQPYYDMAPLAVTKALRRFPMAGDFITFPVETIRCSINSWINAVNDAKQGDLRPMIGTMMAHAAGVELGATVIGAAIAGALALLLGDDWQKHRVDIATERDMRELLPEYRRNATFVTWRAADGSIRYLDYDYIQPYEMVNQIYSMIAADRPAETKVRDFARFLGQQFSGLSMGPAMVAELMLNRDKRTGKEIQSSLDTIAENATAVGKKLFTGMAPTIVLEATLAAQAAMREGSLVDVSGEEDTTVGHLVKATTPIRVRTFDPATALTFRARELARYARDLKMDAGTARRLEATDRISTADYDAQVELTTAKMEGAVNDRLSRLITAAGRFLDPGEINGALQGAGWSKGDITAATLGTGLTYQEP